MWLRATFIVAPFAVVYTLLNFISEPAWFSQEAVAASHIRAHSDIPPPVQKVVLVAYHRGGSSFLGELFNHNPAAFYWFEPLAHVVAENAWRLRLDQEQFYFTRNGTARALPETILDDLVDNMINILACNFKALDAQTLTHYFITQWEKSNKMLPFKKCLNDNNVKYTAKSKLPVIIAKCVVWLEQACLTSRLRAIKTIRLPGFVAKRLLQRDPSIKVVYYTRDIRGILVSRSKFNDFAMSRLDQVRGQAFRQCAWIKHDLEVFSQLGPHHPVLHLRYEDLALRPFETTDRVYDFLHMRYPGSLTQWLRDNTRASSDNGQLGTARNSSQTAYGWRRELSSEAETDILTLCADVLQQQGYKLGQTDLFVRH